MCLDGPNVHEVTIINFVGRVVSILLFMRQIGCLRFIILNLMHTGGCDRQIIDTVTHQKICNIIVFKNYSI